MWLDGEWEMPLGLVKVDCDFVSVVVVGLEYSRGYESGICIYVCRAFMDGLMVIWSSGCCGFKHGRWWTLVASCGELASFALHPVF